MLDYISKIAVLESFAPGESRIVTSFFNLVLVFNKGAAFSAHPYRDGRAPAAPALYNSSITK